MGKCEYCGQPAGIFKKLHKECKEEQEELKKEDPDPGFDEFIKNVALFNLQKTAQKLSQKSSKKSQTTRPLVLILPWSKPPVTKIKRPLSEPWIKRTSSQKKSIK